MATSTKDRKTAPTAAQLTTIKCISASGQNRRATWKINCLGNALPCSDS